MGKIDYVFGAVWAALFAALVATAVYLCFEAATNSGPNCPGMDPDWIGKCEAGK